MYNKSKQRNLMIFIIGCVALLAIFGFIFYKSLVYQNASSKINLEFKTPKNNYEINTKLEAISFIKKTNASNIIYPEIDTSKIGEHTYIYVAMDNSGHKREFVLVLNIVDSIKPVIKLKTETITKEEGFDKVYFKDCIEKCYDPVDGDLEPKITIPKNYKEVGTHIITVTATDINGNTTTKEIKFVVKKKETENKSKDKKTENKNTETNKDTSSSKQNSTSTNAQNNNNDNKTETKALETVKPPNQKFLFSDGYDMDSATNTCTSKLWEAKNKGFSGGCFPIKDSNNIYIGMELRLD